MSKDMSKYKDEEGKSYLTEAIACCESIQVLTDTSVWINAEIQKCIIKDDRLDLGWAERENNNQKMEELHGRLIVSIEELIKIDKKYRALCEKVNKKYGNTVINIPPPISIDGYNAPFEEDGGSDLDGLDFGKE
jgi:hypothetical protein